MVYLSFSFMRRRTGIPVGSSKSDDPLDVLLLLLVLLYHLLVLLYLIQSLSFFAILSNSETLQHSTDAIILGL